MARHTLLGFTSVLALGVTACTTVAAPADHSEQRAEQSQQIDRPSGAIHWPGLPPDSHQYVNRRLDEIESAPRMEGGVLFVGDSITDGAPLYAMFPNLKIANHGIAWDTTDGVLLRLHQITRHNPDRIFVMIGTNDTDYTDSHEQISRNILKIAERLTIELPETELYVVSILPRGGPGNAVISATNERLASEASNRAFTFLDLAGFMRGSDGEMDPALSYDNLHLNVHGYAVWEQALGACVWTGCPAGLED